MTITKKVIVPAFLTAKGRSKQREKIQAQLESQGWTIKEYFDGGITKPCYFMVEGDAFLNKAKTPSSLTITHKILLGLFAIFFLYYLFSPDPTKPVLSDKELFLTYYSALILKTNAADNMYRPFSDSLSKGKLLIATQEALRIKQPLDEAWSQIYNFKPPILKNEAANKKLEEAYQGISGAYMEKTSIVSNFISLSESQNLKKIAEISNSAENIQTLMIGSTVRLMEAGTLVGVKPEEFPKI